MCQLLGHDPQSGLDYPLGLVPRTDQTPPSNKFKKKSVTVNLKIHPGGVNNQS